MENKKPKGLQIFGICMIVVAAILTGVFLGAWAVNYDYNSYNSCSAEVPDSLYYKLDNIIGFCPGNNNYYTQYSVSFARNSGLTYFRIEGYNYYYTDYSAPQFILTNYIGSSSSTAYYSQLSYGINLGTFSFDSLPINSLNNIAYDNLYPYYSGTGSTPTYSVSGDSYLMNSNCRYYVFSSCSSSFGDIVGYTVGNFTKNNNVLGDWDGTFVNFSQFTDYIFNHFDNGSWAFVSLFDSNYNRLTLFLQVGYTNQKLVQSFGTSAYLPRERFIKNPNPSADDLYNKGVSDGYRNGYNVGYNDGVADDNDYTFFGLMGAVVDAPVQVFSKMFDFTILGVNLKDFLLGLFGVAVTITILKFILVR